MLNDWGLPSLVIRLPSWVERALPAPNHVYVSDAAKMQLAIDLSRLNVEHGTGGPFGAAVFNRHSNMLISPGVNLVVSCGWSGAHAEIISLALAQQIIRSHNLGSTKSRAYELFSSSEPCSMCLGAVQWSGVSRLVTGARDPDVRQIGFDEGDKSPDWEDGLISRGVSVSRDVLRDKACFVLQSYRRHGGLIY